jgi:hypothetical protein
VYREALGRAPGAEELKRSLEFLESADPSGSKLKAWSRLYQALFTSAEFRYRS